MDPREDPTYVEDRRDSFMGKGEGKPLSRAERRRIERGAYEGEPGRIGCKFCKSTRGTYYSATNRFVCHTKGCKGATHHGA